MPILATPHYFLTFAHLNNYYNSKYMSTRKRIKQILNSTEVDYDFTIKGWVRSFRNNTFIAVNDGSTNLNLQVVIDFTRYDDAFLKRITTGAAISAAGKIVASQGKGQSVELQADVIEIIGDCDAEKYPLQLKNKPSLDYLREIAHLRFRTNTFGSVFRLRNALAFGIHQFFQERDFVYLHSPFISASDADGEG